MYNNFLLFTVYSIGSAQILIGLAKIHIGLAHLYIGFMLYGFATYLLLS